jgi:hypothetical protein
VNKRRENAGLAQRKLFMHELQEDIDPHILHTHIHRHGVHGERSEKEAWRMAGTSGMVGLQIERKSGRSGRLEVGRLGTGRMRRRVKARRKEGEGRGEKERRGKNEKEMGVEKVTIGTRIDGEVEEKMRTFMTARTDEEGGLEAGAPPRDVSRMETELDIDIGDQFLPVILIH